MKKNRNGVAGVMAGVYILPLTRMNSIYLDMLLCKRFVEIKVISSSLLILD